ncbi:flagellar associated membrane [Chlorella sorokiniana]|uniref:Flagellar associated membrane n=1 Tax=Chlorella sorokiniana TaxID=3076 RepID=A0A2P6TEN4_CHLSO|nr:flagellar associated membrane [Chlorella sorokiniana]|eukprot:PRW21106.1 flagellar associated membrane [Chlorella sorokiniana]
MAQAGGHAAEMQRSNSTSSAGSGSTGFSSQFSGASANTQGSQPPDGGNGSEDVAAELAGGSLQGSLQEATFGALYTLSKEKFSEGWRWVLCTMIIDYLQLAVFFIGNNFMWTMNFRAWQWKRLSWVCFTNMFPPHTGLGNGNYTFYQVVFYTLTVILVASFVLCAFVGHSFKTGSFPWLWPIKVLKVAVSFFFEKFPQVQCFAMPHLAAVCISVFASLLAMGMAYFVSVANSELDPLRREPSGQAHHRSSVKRFFLISIITLINEMFPSYTKLQGVVCIIICFYLMYNYVRYVPFQTPWVNGLQASFFASLTWASLVIILAAWIEPATKPASPLYTYLLWLGILPSIAAAWCLLYYRYRWAHRVALRYRASLQTKQKVVHKFFDELEVGARCGRITDQWGEPVQEWIDTAELVLQAGLEQFPESPYLHILYSSFLIEARKQYQRASGMLEQARKLEPGIGERFMLFVRDREQKQRQGGGGSDGSYDLLSYVEFTNSYRALVRRDVKFEDLTKAFVSMDAAERRAEVTYKTVLDKYSSSAKLLRAYGRFLEDVRSNPWAAMRYYSEADRLEMETREMAHDASAIGEGGDSDRSLNQMVDDSADAVVVSNDVGIIQFNKPVTELFGWSQSEMQGKNINMLMGPPAAAHHNQYLQRYKKTGQCTVMNTTRVVTALHREGNSFPLQLSLKEVKQGDSKAYMAIMRPVKQDAREACLWVGSAGQVVGVDTGFSNMFGWTMADLHGQLVGSIGVDESLGAQFATVSDQLKHWDYKAEDIGKAQHAFTVRLRHKFGASVEVSGEASFAGTTNMRTIMLKFLLDERIEELGLVSINQAGAIVYCNATFETMLGLETGSLVAKKRALTELVKGPSAKMMPRWLQGYARDPSAVAPSSCRNGRVVVLSGHNNKEVPVRLTIEPCQVGRMRLLTATVTKQPIPPADAWGGGDVKDMLDSAKRLQLLVRSDGRILTFKADPAVLTQVFGQDAAALNKKVLSELVPDLAPPHGFQSSWPSEGQLLRQLSAHASAAAAGGSKPGVRVVLQPDPHVLSLRERMALGAAGSMPCRLVVLPLAETELDVAELVDEGFMTQADVADGGCQVVEVWREELLEATLEIDASLKVRSMDAEACLLFGLTRESVKSKSVLTLLKPQDYRLPHDARCEDFLGIKRSQLKHTADASVSDKQGMDAQHVDGSTVAVQVQGCDRHGDGSRWTLRVTVAPVQPAGQQRPHLLQVLESTAADHHDSSESEEEEADHGADMQIQAVASGPVKAASQASGSEKDGASSIGDGQSSMGASSEGGEASGDFQRAKRFKKLNRMLNSPQARVVINALHKWSAVMILAIIVLHITLFSVTYKQIQSYTSYLRNTISSGEAATMTQKLLYSSRIKMSAQDTSNIFSYYNYNRTWASELAADFTPFTLRLADDVDTRVRHVFLGESEKHQVSPTVPARKTLFISPVIPFKIVVPVLHPFPIEMNMSLWDLSRRFTTAARLVAVPQPDFAGQLANYAEYQFMRNNQLELSNSLIDNLAMAEDKAHLGLSGQTTIMVIFMAVEAGFVVPICCLALYILLNLVNKARLRTFNVFVVLPRPVVLQLASKEIKLRLDDEQQQKAGEASPAAKGKAGYAFNTSQRRKLTNSSLATYKMLLAFLGWACIVLLTYGLSILLLRASIKPVSDLAASQKLHYLVSRLTYNTQKLCVSATAATAATEAATVLEAVDELEAYKAALLYGSAELGLTGSVLVGGSHEALWFGTGCLFRNASRCYPAGHEYYEVTNYGLNRLLNQFVDAATVVAHDDFSAQALSNKQFQFIWEVGQEGGALDDAMLTNTEDYVKDGKKRMASASIIQILALVALFFIFAYFWLYQLRPFMRRAKQESRRVAELLSQLPPEMAVEELVAEASSMDDKEDKEAAKLRKQQQKAEAAAAREAAAAQKRAAAAAVAADGGKGGGLFGRSKVAPEPGGKAGGGALHIVVRSGSKDKEGIPAGDHALMAKYSGYHERMHRRQADGNIDATDDPTLWVNRSPRKISFAQMASPFAGGASSGATAAAAADAAMAAVPE